MSPQPQMYANGDQAVRWSLARRAVFRLCFVYLGLFCLLTQILPSLIPWDVESLDLSVLPPVRQMVTATATHVFHVRHALVWSGSGSGDKTYDWVLSFCLLAIAIVAAAVWSVWDARRPNYDVLHRWFRLAIRFALASQMLVYGFSKAVPLQMPFPFLQRLLEPYGNFSPMGVLWSAVGASPAYEMFAGCCELLGGILLIIPRTAVLGAVVSLAVMVQVFVLNMTYDVPVKLFAFHLIVMSVFLLAPYLREMADFFLGRRDVKPAREPRLFASARANRIAGAAQIVFGLLLVSANVYGASKAYGTYGPGRPRSALYGIWDVQEMSVAGQLRPPLATDRERWRRVVFDFQESSAWQRADDSFVGYGTAIDSAHQTLTLTRAADKNWKAVLHFARPAKGDLVLEGDMDGHPVHLKLHAVDVNQFTLKSRGFQWVQEYPFNK